MYMRYALLKSPFKVFIKQEKVSSPDENHTRIKTAFCGICGTDRIMAKNGFKRWTRFGHEVSGTIDKIGRNVEGFKLGQKVSIKPGAPCGNCSFCTSGIYRKCSNIVVATGGFSEYLVVDPRSVAVAGEHTDLKSLSLTEPLNVAIDILETAQIRKNDSIILFGPGLIGLLALYVAKSKGAKPLALVGRNFYKYLEVHQKKLDAHFIKYDPDRTFFKSRKNSAFPASLQDILAKRPISRLVVIHTAPPGLIAGYASLLPYETTIVNIGLASEPKLVKMQVDMRELMFKRISLLSSFAVPSLFFGEAIEYLSNGLINSELFIDKVVNLEQLQGEIRPIKPGRKNLKVVIALDGARKI
jgi:L-iditol 2-dehydrogenase